jgi:histone-lysine N-methyltransferase SETMAR
MIQKAFGNDSLSRTKVFRWHKDFVNGRETVADEPRSGHPASVRTSTNVDHVRAFVRQDQRLKIRIITDELNINECTVHQIFTQDFNTRKVCANMVPKNVNDNQKARRKEVSAVMLQWVENEPDVLNQVVTGDESWFFEYDPETKRQSEEWHTPQSP